MLTRMLVPKKGDVHPLVPVPDYLQFWEGALSPMSATKFAAKLVSSITEIERNTGKLQKKGVDVGASPALCSAAARHGPTRAHALAHTQGNCCTPSRRRCSCWTCFTPWIRVMPSCAKR